MPVITRILARRGTSSAWSAANPILGAGEMGWDTTALRFKMGDGVTAWTALAYSGVAELNGKADVGHSHADLDSATDVNTPSTIVKRSSGGWINAFNVAVTGQPTTGTHLTRKDYVDTAVANANSYGYKQFVNADPVTTYPIGVSVFLADCGSQGLFKPWGVSGGQAFALIVTTRDKTYAGGASQYAYPYTVTDLPVAYRLWISGATDWSAWQTLATQDYVNVTQQAALALKADLESPAFTGTPTGITATHVGLGSVNNTADTAKPVSTAQQTALNLKANLASPAFTGTPTGITKTHVGLSLVDNTADTAKPVSTAQQTALNGKADSVHTHAFGDIVATELGVVDLNDIIISGDYFQSQNADAVNGTNYPETAAGFLEVRSYAGFVYQTYHLYQPYNRKHWRTRYSGNWSTWSSTAADTNVLGTSANPVTNASATRPTGMTSVWWLTATKPVNSISGDIWMVAP